MKKKIVFIFCLCATMILHAAVYKTVTITAGGLSAALTTTEKTTITDLTVTGTIDARDVKVMRDNLPNLAILNISGVIIQAYTGTEGTVSSSTIFPVNEMPMKSFTDSNYSGKATLTSVLLPNSITAIGFGAFNYCSGLSSITIPGSVTSIGDYALFGCSGITNITLPSSVHKIGNYALSNCTGLTSLTIPNSVTSIGYGAFSLCTGITSINIPNAVTSISESTFYGCSGIASITIPNSVLSIGENAFKNCTGISSITIPSSIHTIKNNTFSNCSGLTSIVMPNTVDSIGDWSFAGCTKLANVTIPVTVTSIGSSAFYNCTGITSITIPNSVTSMGESVFFNCTGLTTATIPASLTSINKSTFANCSGLSNMIIPSTVTSIGSWSFSNCSKLTNITIPNTVSIIGDGTFSGCIGLAGVTLSNAITSISNYTFNGCTALSALSIPNSVTSIGNNAFDGCTALTTVTIPSLVTSIGDYAFSNNTKLASITIPNSVTSIGNYAFSYCIGLTSVILPNSINTISLRTFDHCSGLINISIPNSVKSIGDYAFIYCTGLTSITIPNSVTTIGNYSIYSCTKLISISLPNTVTSIGNFAFYNCLNINSITIPNSVTTIGSYAFSACSRIVSLTIPKSVNSIGTYAFSSKNIDSIFVYSSEPVNLSNSPFAFKDIDKTACTLLVPYGKKAAYMAANQWMDFTDIKEMASTSTYTHKIALASGWNIISSNVIPPVTDLKTIFQPLINNGKLIKVMDETGKAIENFASLGGWINGIGNFSQTEGYKVFMTSADTITLNGEAVKLPLKIALGTGWNIISYPCTNDQSAQAMVQTLISGGKLKKVMDESGKSIEDFGVFGGWKNEIGNFNPGKGYKIFMSSADTLSISSTALRALTATRSETLESTYFTKIWQGNGTDHMNINLVELESSTLNIGDEIGIFDGENCVGSAIIGSDHMAESSISIPTSCNDDQTQTVNGFIPGHPVSLRIYSDGVLYQGTIEKLLGSDIFGKDGSLFAKVVSKEFIVSIPTAISKTEASFQITCYPNPFVEGISIDVKNALVKEMTIEIYSLSGQKIKVLYQGETDSIHLKWNGTDGSGNKVIPGVYLCKVNNSTKKIVYTGNQ